jgi:hypothetical protein
MAHVVGKGHVLPEERVKSAIRSVYRYNFKESFEDHANPQRIFALNDEGGLLLCSWPRGERPLLPFVYSDEVWTGIEYQVAAHLIYEGFVDEGVRIVRAVRNRYDGERRNPWNEVECGNHYARALASWSLLLALSGFRYSAPERSMTFDPRTREREFACFWSVGEPGFGVYRQERSETSLRAAIRLDHGRGVSLTAIVLPGEASSVEARLDGRVVEASLVSESTRSRVRFATAIALSAGQTLRLTLS